MRYSGRMQRIARTVGVAAFIVASNGYAQQASTRQDSQEQTIAQQAAAAFWKGKSLYDSGEYGQAREQFERAYYLVKDPTLLYNIGQSYRQQGECQLARESYAKFREQAPDSPLAAQADEHLAVLNAACPPPVAPKVDALAQPPNLPSPPGAAVSRPSTPAVRSEVVLAPALPATSTRQTGRIWTISTLVAGLVAGGAATGIGIWNHHRYAQWQQRDRALAKGAVGDETDAQWAARQQSNDELNRSIERTDRSVVLVGFGAGALLAASAVLFFTIPAATPTPTPQRTIGLAYYCQPRIFTSQAFHFSLQGSF
jgi:tetratricopeptide (TPR) repeat protein